MMHPQIMYAYTPDYIVSAACGSGMPAPHVAHETAQLRRLLELGVVARLKYRPPPRRQQGRRNQQKVHQGLHVQRAQRPC
jgi:hypothetical protein